MKPNLFVEYARSEIFEKGRGSPARVRQKRKDASVGISIVGDLDKLSFKSLFAKEKQEENAKPAKPKIIEEEDGVLIE